MGKLINAESKFSKPVDPQKPGEIFDTKGGVVDSWAALGLEDLSKADKRFLIGRLRGDPMPNNVINLPGLPEK